MQPWLSLGATSFLHGYWGMLGPFLEATKSLSKQANQEAGGRVTDWHQPGSPVLNKVSLDLGPLAQRAALRELVAKLLLQK